MHALVALLMFAAGSDDEATTQLVVEGARVSLSAEVLVPAREAGVLAALTVKEGDVVKAGQEIALIDDQVVRIEQRLAQREYEVAKEQSQNDVDVRYARKSRTVATTELKRSLDANQIYPVSVSGTELDRLRLVVDRNALSIEQAERDLRVARLNEQIAADRAEAAAQSVKRRRILAPINGLVVEIFKHREEWCNVGEPVVRIIDLDNLRVEAFVDGNKFGTELKDCHVDLLVAVPPGRVDRFGGKIVFVNPELQPVTRQMRIWADVSNREMLLRPGDQGTLEIELGKQDANPKPSN